MPTGLFRIFRKKLLILMSTAVALIGIALIIISQFITKPGWHEALVGIGAAIFATGPITILVWWVTDDIYRNELSNTLKDVPNEVFKKFEQGNSVINMNKTLGIVGIYLQRVEALNDFKIYLNEEIERAKQGQQARLWFVCTDLQGFLEVSMGAALLK